MGGVRVRGAIDARCASSVEAVRAQLTHEPIGIFHLIYRDRPYEVELKDYEFSRATVEDHWTAGASAMGITLSHPQAPRSDARPDGVTTFDLGDAEAIKVKRPITQENPR